jgi:hypothetical protein
MAPGAAMNKAPVVMSSRSRSQATVRGKYRVERAGARVVMRANKVVELPEAEAEGVSKP